MFLSLELHDLSSVNKRYEVKPYALFCLFEISDVEAGHGLLYLSCGLL